MANKFKGEISLTHEGVSYTMVLDFNALCDFEGETGRNALIVLDGMERGRASATDMRALMWAGLRQRHPDMTMGLAGQILGENLNAVADASKAMMPDADKAAPGNVPSPRKKRA